MQLLISLALFMLVTGSAHAATVCNKNTVTQTYIPKLKDSAEWSDKMLMPYALRLCKLDQQKEVLQKQVADSTNFWIKENNSHTCADLSPDDPEKEMSAEECVKAYRKKIDGMIDQCRATMSLGRNPHNVYIEIDSANVEITCLRSTLVFLKWNENFLKGSGYR